ncbi:MAG: hypothetical protein OCD01_07415 [Fibrobacterales bacterium]
MGKKLAETDAERTRRMLLYTSLGVNLGFLGVFKYYNFFIDSFIDAFTVFGMPIQGHTLSIVLPVGISFYTFQTLSYSIDVYKRKLEPSKDVVSFFAYVSFFPQLVAGPIERATNLLPQFYNSRKFEYSKARDGLRQILWGLFKKIAIADNCAQYANMIFENSENYSASTLVLGVVLFAFQIYGDFSGYSDVAIGTSRLFGFDLMRNFAFPYFSRDIAEFWRRWHISLSTWFRDYLYIPLGGSRGGKKKQVINTLIIFSVSGFWHGANWTFIIWGVLHALFFMPILLIGKNRVNTNCVAETSILPSVKELFQMVSTFTLVCLGWIFFRADSLDHAIQYVFRIFDYSFFSGPEVQVKGSVYGLVGLLILIEWLQRKRQHGLDFNGIKVPILIRWSLYNLLILLVMSYGGSPQAFIYFQF